ncbi:MAG: diguanylate cyclase [Hoeflea sp.]|uniref:diguanylate cyclase n=1 Tax=Hoeflea sp. TaxID=1940281 RepID=UPI001DE7A574|nr:diguanylate cyclase [Hoeflea sp.]MBU4529821.1 diguanylate cyclase [Alphaproteobacteria bacterium]MBU4547158.1 diguanylate cyclase [Alphaproteobacteria bacterium]MBU4548771.1 diguanylate cyclase [Alphaproteobacteria bacterium]MBV1722313.1 diguanylate cyclase [Hoeflea sp.]MBV1762530.1 diguanylate cyclase [Hoeflea sp.]
MSFSTPILLVIALLAVLVVGRIVTSPQAPGRIAFGLAAVASIWWIAMVVLRLNSEDLSDKILFSRLAWFGIIATPLFWSAGFLDHAGFNQVTRRLPIAIILTISALAGFAALTDGYHQWIYTGIINEERPTFSHGWLFYALLGGMYLCMLLACLMSISQLKHASRLHRRQMVALLIATCVPWGCNAAFVLFEFRLFNDDPTPFAFSATVLAVLFAQHRGKLFIAPPIARDVIFSILPDPIVVLEPSGLVLETNPAAAKLTGFSAETVGTKLPPSHPLMAFVARDMTSETGKPIVHFDAMGKTFEVSVQPLEHWGRQGNVMIVLRDVTAREAAQKSLSDAGQALKLRLEENLRLQEQLEQQAFHDHLTGLFNRRHASTVIPPVIANASEDAPVALIIVDLDYFKQVNDLYGHDVGDKVLSTFALILRDSLRDTEMAFRHGGEEFLVVLPATSRAQALDRCARWRHGLATHAIAELKDFALSFSAGIALAPQAGTSLTACTKAADIALYRAKISGRNTDIVWGEHLDGLVREGPAPQGNAADHSDRKASPAHRAVSP